MIARFKSTCIRCKKPIARGHNIRRLHKTGPYVHVDCKQPKAIQLRLF